jgi:hypothetical protein
MLDEDVRRLQVAVHDSLPVRVRQRLRHLAAEVDHLARRKATGAAFQQRAEILALQQLSDDEHLAVVHAGVMHDGDARVLKASAGGRLTAEAHQQLLARVGVAQHLDRHGPAKPTVKPAPDLAHGAPAQPVS